MSEERAGLLDGAIAPVSNIRLFGHEAAEEFLARSYRSGKGHHAVLIEGPEGIGKATLAFRFANHILRHPDPATAPEAISDPDPEHPVTRQLASGASHNLLHLWLQARPLGRRRRALPSTNTLDSAMAPAASPPWAMPFIWALRVSPPSLSQPLPAPINCSSICFIRPPLCMIFHAGPRPLNSR